MARNQQPMNPIFHLDGSQDAVTPGNDSMDNSDNDVIGLLKQLLDEQRRQTDLLSDLKDEVNAAQRQRANELGQWKQQNPELARNCRLAAESLSRVQAQFLDNLTEEVNDSEDGMLDGEFLLNEFVDRFGPRLAHLNGVLQVLSQLSSVPNPANSNNTP
jgi:hypothetical protein